MKRLYQQAQNRMLRTLGFAALCAGLSWTCSGCFLWANLSEVDQCKANDIAPSGYEVGQRMLVTLEPDQTGMGGDDPLCKEPLFTASTFELRLDGIADGSGCKTDDWRFASDLGLMLRGGSMAAGPRFEVDMSYGVQYTSMCRGGLGARLSLPPPDQGADVPYVTDLDLDFYWTESDDFSPPGGCAGFMPELSSNGNGSCSYHYRVTVTRIDEAH